MKYTKTNVKKLLNTTKSELEKDVLNYILDEWENYSNNRIAIITDVLEYGCVSGMVGHLIYYSDTTAYYDEHKEEINELLYNLLWGCGFKSPSELFGDKWDEEDPLCINTYNKNLMAWFGFEETMRNVASKFEELEDHI